MPAAFYILFRYVLIICNGLLLDFLLKRAFLLGEVACAKCIRQREQLSAVLPRASLQDSTKVEHSNHSEILNVPNDEEEPNGKRFKQMPSTDSAARREI